MKIWVGVEVYQLIVQGVHLFENFEKAKEWFKEYTGVSWEDYVGEGNLENGMDVDFDQTKIFEEEIPAEKKEFDPTKPGHYFFDININGTGKNAEEAWDHAVEGFIDEPGGMDPDEISEFLEEV